MFAQEANTISAPRFELSSGYAFIRDTRHRHQLRHSTWWRGDDLGARVAVDYRAMIDSQRDDVPGHIDYANALRVIAGFTLHWGGR